MTTHVKVLTALAFVVGVLGFLGAITVTVVYGFVGAGINSAHDENSRIALAVLGLGAVALVTTLAIFSALNLACGWGLMNRKRWGRLLAIGVACVSLIFFPIGSVVGAYALWVL